MPLVRTRRFAAAAALALALAFAAAARAQTPPDEGALAHADSLYVAQAWDAAAAAYAGALAGRPDDGLRWYRYGTSLLQAGRPADAVPALVRAEAIGHHPRSMYNLACALARLERRDEALTWLETAAGAGFAQSAALEADPDLAALHADARWAGVLAAVDRNARPCAHDERHRQLDFWLGDWDVTMPAGQPAGESRVEAILGTCVVFENWTGYQGTSGKSFNFIDPAGGAWRQTWVDDKGDLHEYVGEFRDGAMRFGRETVDEAGTVTQHRMTLFDLEPGHVRQLGETSTDGGATWVTQYDLHYRRRAAGAAGG